MKKAIQRIYEILCIITKWITLEYEKKNNQYRIEQEKIQDSRKKQKIYYVMKILQNELYQGFQYSNFGQIISIRAPSNIRIVDYEEKNNITIFIYEIDKKNSDQIPYVICDKIKKDMNIDLFKFYSDLYMNFTKEDIFHCYPCFYHGISVVDVVNNNMSVSVKVIIKGFKI